MADIVKFIFVKIIFLSIFIIARDIEGNTFFILCKKKIVYIIFYYILILYFYSYFSSQQELYVLEILIVEMKGACLVLNRYALKAGVIV